MKILVADGLAPEGIAYLRSRADVIVAQGLEPDALRAAIADADAVIVRGRTRIDRTAIAAAGRLRVIARAGVGVDNIDVDAATLRGILVLNTPESSTVSTAEHTLAMLLALARRIPAAQSAASRGIWQREGLTGVELAGKTLGVVGLGRIGAEVTRRAAAFGMRVIGFDPYVSPERATRVGAELVTWDELVERSDVITLHIPLTPATRHLIGERELGRMRQGVRLVNCARGGLIDEQALLAAIEEGKVAGAALDVFEEEPPRGNPLLAHPAVVVTPHLGASTEEAQRSIAVQVAEEVVAALEGVPVRGAVNAPVLHTDSWLRLAPFVDLMRALGAVGRELAEGQVREVELIYEGTVAHEQLDLLGASFLAGLLESVSEHPVNIVNAALVAKDRGIALAEVRREESEDFSSLIRVRLVTTAGALVVGGTLFGQREPRITHLDDYRIDLVPAPHMLFVWNVDRPGMIGRVGSILGAQKVNIAGMQVGRTTPGGTAVMVITIDSPAPQAAIAELARVDGITAVKVVDLAQSRAPGARAQ